MPKSNNFDLIRLVAALQVAFIHSATDLKAVTQLWPAGLLVGAFPGVPVFFFVSGFLISRSFERNSNLKEFALNRFLRIYPGLAVCFLVSVLSVWLCGYFQTVNAPLSSFLLWAAAQLTIVQFYNPDFMRLFGLGVLNGSVWTITVELQFYILVPVVYTLFGLLRGSARRANAALAVLTLIFMVFNQIFVQLEPVHAHEVWYKLLGVTFIPWFYMFLVGVLFQRNFLRMHNLLGRRFLVLMVAYGLLVVVSLPLRWGFGNLFNPLQFIALCCVTFSAAFSAPALSDRLLRRNDLSYGVYMYHAPVINLMLVTGIAVGVGGVALVLGVSLTLAWASWCLIEKPALKLKRHPLYEHEEAPRLLPG
jgi:peptidoglycan/LPS O-acetylase OafA/YrhL